LPGALGAVSDVENPPPGDVVTVVEPVGPLTLTLTLPGKYEPLTEIALPGA
jgi:hypothetical protein